MATALIPVQSARRYLKFDEFRAAIRKSGIIKPNRFSVWFAVPYGMLKTPGYNKDIKKILLFCSKAELPGMNLSTAPVRTTGEIRNVPYDRNFETLNLSFYADSNMSAKYFFDEWINLVQNRYTRQFSYFDDYSTPTLTVQIEEVDDSPAMIAVLKDAYPKSISTVQLDHADSGFVQINVSFEYRYWETIQMDNGRDAGLQPPILKPGESFVNIQGSAFPGISKTPIVVQMQGAPIAQPSIFGKIVGDIGSSISSIASRIGGLVNAIPEGMQDPGNTATINSMVAQGNTYVSSNNNNGLVLASPAGTNMGPIDVNSIYGLLNGTKSLVANTSAIAGSIAAFIPNSTGGIATQLGNINSQLNLVGASIFSTTTKINSSVIAATNAAGQLGRLVAPNQQKGQ